MKRLTAAVIAVAVVWPVVVAGAASAAPPAGSLGTLTITNPGNGSDPNSGLDTAIFNVTTSGGLPAHHRSLHRPRQRRPGNHRSGGSHQRHLPT